MESVLARAPEPETATAYIFAIRMKFVNSVKDEFVRALVRFLIRGDSPERRTILLGRNRKNRDQPQRSAYYAY